ncbi:MAG: type II toxin-antitoxin system RelE/ParE family toxin [Bacteroidales bacterium]|nr:type II toxin-antitoxin system RelE/ParE family toxin [Bacteroidales bacterium]
MPPIKISFRSTYHESLESVMKYSAHTFGKRVTNKFYSEIQQKVRLLFTMPNMYAKCRFIDSTDSITFRNITVRSYLIIYSVTAHQVTVIDIIHSSINPENMKNRVE